MHPRMIQTRRQMPIRKRRNEMIRFVFITRSPLSVSPSMLTVSYRLTLSRNKAQAQAQAHPRRTTRHVFLSCISMNPIYTVDSSMNDTRRKRGTGCLTDMRRLETFTKCASTECVTWKPPSGTANGFKTPRSFRLLLLGICETDVNAS